MTIEQRAFLFEVLFRLIAQKGWNSLDIAAIAKAIDMPTRDLRAIYPTPTSLLELFHRSVDTQVITAVPYDAMIPRHDMLCELLLTRLDFLAPYQEGIRRLWQERFLTPILSIEMTGWLKSSMQKMLMHSHWKGHNHLKVFGLVFVYTEAIGMWAHAPTTSDSVLAFLDRRLRQWDIFLVDS